jgi:excisionase family DNA binding protein
MEQLQFELKGLKTLGIPEVAELLQIHPVTLRAMCKSGEIPAVKVGKSWVMLEDDLRDWIRGQYSQAAVQSPVSLLFGEKSCSTSTQTVTGMQSSSSVESKYADLLGLKTNA